MPSQEQVIKTRSLTRHRLFHRMDYTTYIDEHSNSTTSHY